MADGPNQSQISNKVPMPGDAPKDTPNVGKLVEGDSLDVDGLRALSDWETDQEIAKNPDYLGVKNGKKSKEEKGKQEVEASSEDGEDDEEVTDSDESEEESEETEDEDSEDDSEEEDEEEETPAPKSKKVTLKDGNRNVEISDSAIVGVKVDGKIVEMPLADVIKTASGKFHYDSSVAKLNQDKRQFETERRATQEKFKKAQDEADTIAENLELLHEAAASGSPEQVVELFALMAGKDPDKVMEHLFTESLRYAKRLHELTPDQRKLENDYRRLSFKQKLNDRRAEKDAVATRARTEQQQVLAALQERGLTNEDWIAAAAELKGKLENGELEKVTPFDVVNHATEMKRTSLINDAISQVDKSLAQNDDFKRRVKAAVVQTEAITGSKMKVSEIRKMVQAVREDPQSSLKERLSRKAERARKSPVISEHATSRKQNDAGALTLEDHYDKLRNYR